MTDSAAKACPRCEGASVVIALTDQRALDLRFRLAHFRAWVVGVEGIELKDRDLAAVDDIYVLLGGGGG
jgi:hypothetical protein